jgi:hypothetical protein
MWPNLRLRLLADLHRHRPGIAGSALFALPATDLLADAIDLASLLALLWLLHGCHIRVLATPTPGIGVRNRKGNSEQTNKKSNTQFHGETRRASKPQMKIYWLGLLRSTMTFVTQPKLLSLAPNILNWRCIKEGPS